MTESWMPWYIYSRFGRPSKDYPDDWDELVEKYEQGEMVAIEVAEICNIITTTFYRRRKN